MLCWNLLMNFSHQIMMEIEKKKRKEKRLQLFKSFVSQASWHDGILSGNREYGLYSWLSLDCKCLHATFYVSLVLLNVECCLSSIDTFLYKVVSYILGLLLYVFLIQPQSIRDCRCKKEFVILMQYQ